MESHERQCLRLGKRPMAFVVVAALASLLLAWAGPAQAKRIRGTKGPDKIAGTAKADVIKFFAAMTGSRAAVAGIDSFGGRGADRLNAVDGRRDRVVRGGPGKDVCRVDAIDQAKMQGCETVKIGEGRRSRRRRSRRARRSGAPAPARGQARGRRPAARCAWRPAADLQRSVLRDHDHPQSLGGWVERR